MTHETTNLSNALKGNNKLFNVHYNYKAQLKAFNKKFFDPFCRGNRIPFFYDKDNCIITTIGQLNFFKWAISNDVVNYVTENLKDIEVDMNKTNKREVKKEKKKVTYVIRQNSSIDNGQIFKIIISTGGQIDHICQL